MLTWNAYAGKKLDALAFSPCGRALALGGRNLACRLIDSNSGRSSLLPHTPSIVR